ncbi:MAG: DUF1822 family protein [Cyanobacteria bacterium P01_D01_bin.1]
MVTTIYSQQSGIVVPITTASRSIAQRFAQQCSTPEKADQVRRNTLAVYAVHDYLRLLSIPTDLEDGDSWNPLMRQVTDVADLKLPEVGTFACRPITPDSETCHIPPEDWHDRVGYVAVSLNEEAYQATLIGFSTTVPEAEYVPMSSFAPIETLLDRVHLLQPDQATVQSAALPSQLGSVPLVLNRIGQWVDGIIDDSWRTAAELINPMELDFAFRTSNDLVSPTLDTPTTVTDISRAKIVDLGTQLGESVRAVLVVHITQTADRRTSIILQVRPLGATPYLPEGIELNVLDENNNLYIEATSRAIDNYIQLQFIARAGEQFGVRISLGENVFREQFSI